MGSLDEAIGLTRLSLLVLRSADVLKGAGSGTSNLPCRDTQLILHSPVR